MTNNTFTHRLHLDDDPDLGLELVLPGYHWHEMTDDLAIELMTETLLTLAPRVAADAIRISEGNYSDDDTDYIPARSQLVATLSYTLIQDDETPLRALRALLFDYDFVMALVSCDVNIALDINYIG